MQYSVLPNGYKKPKVNLLDPRIRRLLQFKSEAESHLGHSAVYKYSEKRGTESRLVSIHQVHQRFVTVKYPCYDSRGNFRQYLTTSISFTSMLCGEEFLKYIDDEI